MSKAFSRQFSSNICVALTSSIPFNDKRKHTIVKSQLAAITRSILVGFDDINSEGQ